MALCKTSNVSIFTFINASDLKFCNIYKMMTSHFRTLFNMAGCFLYFVFMY